MLGLQMRLFMLLQSLYIYIYIYTFGGFSLFSLPVFLFILFSKTSSSCGLICFWWDTTSHNPHKTPQKLAWLGWFHVAQRQQKLMFIYSMLKSHIESSVSLNESEIKDLWFGKTKYFGGTICKTLPEWLLKTNPINSSKRLVLGCNEKSWCLDFLNYY